MTGLPHVGEVLPTHARLFPDRVGAHDLERTMTFLGDRRIPLVLVDEPQGFKSSVPPITATTSPELAVIRFHGRRAET